MDAIITWAKENYDLISLGVGVLGVLVSIVSLIYAKRTVAKAKKEQEKDKKDEIRQIIAEKQAELKVLQETYHFIDGTTMNNAILRKSVLQNEIEALKKQLQDG